MKLPIKTKYHGFDEFFSPELFPVQNGAGTAQLLFMYQKAVENKNPVILELGTAKGESTTVFLQACEETDGKLVSVDIEDCSDLSDSTRWKFVQSDSTDVKFILSKASYLETGIDILYIDSLHRREHVEKELTGWYPYLNTRSWIFFDDVDANPYRKGHRKDDIKLEVAYNEIHEYVKTFFYANEDDLELSIMYGSTGLACMQKLSPMGAEHRKSKPVVHRSMMMLNMVRYSHKVLAHLFLKRMGL